MIPVILGATALVAAALWGKTDTEEQYGVAQWTPQTDIQVGPGFASAVKDLGNTIAKYPALMEALGPILTQVDLRQNQQGEPGFLRGFAIRLTSPPPPPGTPISKEPQDRQNLKLLEALTVLVGLRHGLAPSFGTIDIPGQPKTFVFGFTTTPNVFWTGEYAMFPSPDKARRIAKEIGGRRPGFDPRYMAEKSLAKARERTRTRRLNRRS